jgi:phage head maturation protease
MPVPVAGESLEEFLRRCIPDVIEDGAAEDGAQGAAMCRSIFESEGGKMRKEHKQIDGMITGVDQDLGVVTAVFAVMGNVDQGNDRIWPGSFTKTFAERGHKVLVLDQHDISTVESAIAKTLGLRELPRAELAPEVLARYPEATGGAEIRAQFILDDPKSAAIFKRLKLGLTSEWSFGYDALQFDFSEEQGPDGQKRNVRNLRQIRLYEVSPVLFGMNSATTTTDAKADPVAAPEEGGAPEDPGVLGDDGDRADSKEMTAAGPIRRLGDVLQSSIHESFTSWADYLYSQGYLDRDQRIQLSGLIGQALDVFTQGMDPAISGIQLGMGYASGAASEETKEGRAISARNGKRIAAAAQALVDLLTEYGIMGGEEDSGDKAWDAPEELAVNDRAGGLPSPIESDAAINRISILERGLAL